MWQHKKILKILKKRLLGFTLIELLVVISIIGTLTTIVTTSINSARNRGRDTKRVSELRQASQALELFYDTYGQYPCGAYSGGGINYDYSIIQTFLDGTEPLGICWGQGPFFGLITAGYLETSITDPINDSSHMYIYEPIYDGSTDTRQKYLLYARLESNDELMKNDGGVCSKIYEVGPFVGQITPYHGPMDFHWPCN